MDGRWGRSLLRADAVSSMDVVHDDDEGGDAVVGVENNVGLCHSTLPVYPLLEVADENSLRVWQPRVADQQNNPSKNQLIYCSD